MKPNALYWSYEWSFWSCIELTLASPWECLDLTLNVNSKQLTCFFPLFTFSHLSLHDTTGSVLCMTPATSIGRFQTSLLISCYCILCLPLFGGTKTDNCFNLMGHWTFAWIVKIFTLFKRERKTNKICCLDATSLAITIPLQKAQIPWIPICFSVFQIFSLAIFYIASIIKS